MPQLTKTTSLSLCIDCPSYYWLFVSSRLRAKGWAAPTMRRLKRGKRHWAGITDSVIYVYCGGMLGMRVLAELESKRNRVIYTTDIEEVPDYAAVNKNY